MPVSAPKMQVSEPNYRLHKTGQAVVTIGGRDHYLGKYGSPASRAKYHRLMAEKLSAGNEPKPTKPEGTGKDEPLSLNELLDAHLDYATTYYQRDGKPLNELCHVKVVTHLLSEMYGEEPAKDFGPLRLRAVRQKMIDAGRCRRHVNQSVMRIRRIFKWAVAMEHVEPGVLQALQAVEPLRYGKSGARETEPVKPVAQAVVDATLPYLLAPVAAMVKLQMLTGARSGEVVIMRTADITTTKEPDQPWSYRPRHHKTQHHGHERVIYIGPRGQAVLKPWLRADLEGFIFNPAEAVKAKYAARPTHRRLPVKAPKTKRKIRDRYSVVAYHRAIQRGCELAFPPAAPLCRAEGETMKQYKVRIKADKLQDQLRQWRREHSWFPHQLRHLAATNLRRDFGLEVAKCVLGQKSLEVAALYAERDDQKARDAMAAVG